MKKLILTQLVLLLFASACFMSCSDDPAAPTVLLPKLDGFYVYGTNTIAENPTDAAARMPLAILDPGKIPNVADEEGVYGKYVYIGANSKISFAEVVSSVGTVYGSSDALVDNGTDLGFSVNDDIVHGTLLADATEINVTDEGLYYVFVNTNTGLFILMPVKANMIGDATPLEWAGGTALPMKSASKDVTVFEGTGIQLLDGHGYRYRVNDGWHTYYEENVLHTLSSLGVAEGWVDANAKDHNDLGFFLENAPHKVTGIYTVTLTYTASTSAWTEVKTKTGDVLIDYTETQMGLFGNAYVTAPEDTAAWVSGEDGYGLHAPTKDGTVYTWTWDNVDLIDAREFIFLEDGAWGGVQIDYSQATVSGEAITNAKIVDATTVGGAYHNFYVSVKASYDITLVIDAQTGNKTITIASN